MAIRSADKRDPNTPTLIADRVNEKLEKNPNRRLPNANMSSAHGEIGAIHSAISQCWYGKKCKYYS